jgi:hypothetical protein
MVRLKEIRLRRKRLASPDVPAASVTLGRVAETVQRPFARPCVSSNPYLGVGQGFHKVGGIPPTYPSLEQVIAIRHCRVGPNGWRVSGERGAARILGLKRTTLEARMKKLRILRPS